MTNIVVHLAKNECILWQTCWVHHSIQCSKVQHLITWTPNYKYCANNGVEWLYIYRENVRYNGGEGKCEAEHMSLPQASHGDIMGKFRIFPASRSARHFSRNCRMSVWEKHSTPPLIQSRSMNTMTNTPQSWPLQADHGERVCTNNNDNNKTSMPNHKHSLP